MLQQEWHYKSISSSNNRTTIESHGDDASNSEEDDEDSANGSTEDGDENATSTEIDEEVSGRESENEELPPTALVQSDRAAARLRIIGALSKAANQTGKIPAEAESMLSEEILRSWDGTSDWGTSLCYDILPYISATGSFADLKGRILLPLEKVFLYSKPEVQYAVVSGVLSSLLALMAAQNISSSAGVEEVTAQQNQQNTVDISQQTRNEALAKRKLIKEYVHWTDELLLQGFLSAPSGTNELLLNAAIDFFRVVCHSVSEHCNLLILPSTSVVYRFLLSRSPVSIDRVCQLLVDYKHSFQTLRASPQQRCSLEVEGLDR